MKKKRITEIADFMGQDIVINQYLRQTLSSNLVCGIVF